MTRRGRLAGRVAVISGATQGIGAAVARRFHLEGARLVLVARRSAPGMQLVEEFADDSARFVAGDVAEERTARIAIQTALASFGALDVLVNNAALDFSRPIRDTSLEEARRIFDVNVLGAFLLLREAGAVMCDKGGGSIVNVVSRYALVGARDLGIYSASKGALLSLTRSAAVEWARHGVRVNAVAPGLTDTPLLRSWIEQQEDPAGFRAHLIETVPLGRLADPSDVAAAALYLASDESRHVTGACLSVDGGYTAQ
jgi:NAD(P)-dependent dehydrogenase (short-subunit alcohol dehydrogenase family)